MLRNRGVNARLASCLNSVLNVKAVVVAFNQEKALVGAFSVLTNLQIEHFQALPATAAEVTASTGGCGGLATLATLAAGSSLLLETFFT